MNQSLSSSFELNTEAPDERVTWFANVILPVPIPKLFTYRIPREMEEDVQLGSRVIVQFGNRKVLTGIVGKLHTEPPKEYTARYLLEVLDSTPIVHEVQIKFFRWIAAYYVCTIGEVLNIALPSGLKLSSELKAQLNPQFDPDNSAYEFTEKESKVLQALEEKKTITYNEIGELLEEKSFYQTIKSLIAKEAILIFEEVKEKYKPKIVKRLRLASAYAQDATRLEELFQQLEKSPKQLDALLAYMHLLPYYHDASRNAEGVLKAEVMARGVSGSSVSTLTKNGVLEEFEEIVSRFRGQCPGR